MGDSQSRPYKFRLAGVTILLRTGEPVARPYRIGPAGDPMGSPYRIRRNGRPDALRLELGDSVAHVDDAVLDDMGIDAAASLARAFVSCGPLARVPPEAAGEFRAAGVRQR